MNHQDVIKTMAQETGLSEENCHKITKAFEEEMGVQRIAKLGKQDLVTDEIVNRDSTSTGVSPEDCRAALTALNKTIANRFSGKDKR